MRIINQCLVRSMSSYQVSNTVRHLTRACGIAGLLAIFILTTTVFPTQTADAAESGTPSQHSILVSLYNDTAGGNWTNNNGWQGAAGTECSWHGVQCNGEGQVTGLNLNNNNLTGVLPGYLGQLSELNGLGLFDNNLSGTIPIELGQLSKLNYMDLGDNQLTGAIPVELGQLSNLSSLYLYNNQLSGSIPDSLGQLSNLTILNLGGNQLTGQIPQSILDLNLTQLSLYGNPLDISAGQRAALIALYDATGGANWTNNTGWLGEPGTECSWYGVQCNAGYVSTLQLVANNLVGTLPVALKDLIRLGDLSLGQNQLSGSIPAEYGELANLGHLGLWANQLSGAIPASLGNMTNLDWISLGGNQLSGSIPAELGNLVGLRGLSLNHNQLSGAIPESLGNLVDLEQVDLQNNQLTGPIPASIGNLGNLQQLRLNRNLLTGAIPAELATLENLQVLHLNNNLLTGAVPAGLLSNNELDLNIWANTGLDIALGSDAACDVQTPLELNGATLEGSLTPYQDCFIQERMEMVDFLQIELTEAFTILRLEANSQHYWPRLGVLDTAAKTLVADQFNNNNLTIEAILPAGTYVPYITGGTYNHEYNVNVPATGDYTVSASTLNEPQVGCNKPTSVVKGVVVQASLNMDDCLTQSEPNRPFDGYTIYLEQGESVTVKLTADFPAQLQRFVNNNFVQATPAAESGVEQGFTVTANYASTQRFEVITTEGTPAPGGSYELSFTEAPGNPDSCTNSLSGIELGGSTNGSLSTDTDCYALSRLTDRLVLSLDEQTIFRATMTSDDFIPLTGVYRAGGNTLLATRGSQSNTAVAEYLLAAGDYWLFTSAVTVNAINPATGDYQFSVGSALSEPQTTGCAATTWVMVGVVANGTLGSTDCIDTVADDAAEVTRYLDGYSMYLAGNETVYVTVNSSIDYRLAWWYNNAIQEVHTGAAGESYTKAISAPAFGVHALYILNENNLTTGSYSIGFSHTPPTAGTQYQILQALYAATAGDNWVNNTGWLGAEGTECDWYGVDCNDQGEVTRLSLDQNNLVGSIPSELGGLASLQQIFMGSNQLSGTVPESLGQLQNLTGIWLYNNQLNGQLPLAFGGLTQLTYLSLSGNQFTGQIPESYGNLVNLRDLSLSYNQLTGGIPASLGNLVQAENIDLRNNQLSGAVPAEVLALGLTIVDLWANPNLTGIALGNPAACDIQTPLSPGVPVAGELTPFDDCYFVDEEGPLMADFYRLDLSGQSSTSLIRIDAYSEAYFPHVGVLDANGIDGLDIVETQIQQTGLSFEVALPPGEYVLYIHGGTYQPQNVAATGAYTLNATTINELQAGCQDFNRSWVTKGVTIDGAISSDDCLDTFSDPDRLYDNYTIWLEQGESVLVTLEAEIATQLLSFNENGFISATNFTAAGNQQGLTVTALTGGWHRFAAYTTTNNAAETGAYTIRFMQPPVFGVPAACVPPNLPSIALGASVNGALDADTDCFNLGRLNDRYVLTINEPMLFRADIETSGFQPQLGLYRAGVSSALLGARVSANNTATLETYLTPGQYWLFASSWETALDTAIEGTYTLNLSQSLALDQLQTGGCAAGDTRVVIDRSTTFTGQVGAGDCIDATEFGDQTGNPERDGYQLFLPQGTAPLRLNLDPDFNARLSVFRNGVFVEASAVSAGQSTSLALTGAGSYQIYVLGQQGPNGFTPDRGNYTLDLSYNAGGQAVPIAFSYTFSGYSNRINNVPETGASSNVLQGVVEAVLVADDIYEITGIREASLAGNPYAVGEAPGITAYGVNQPALISLSGSVLNFSICPNGFTLGNDCPFGTAGGFLISDFFPQSAAPADQSSALAGHPTLGASFRNRDTPINKTAWSANLVTDSVSQRDVLIALYNATGGANWTNNAGWLGAEGTECDWFGVDCDGEGNVTHLRLDNNNLTGSIPSDLGSLITLEQVFMGGNQLSGSIPASLAQLTNLNGIWLYSNQFSGPLPTFFGEMTQLRHLALSGNQFNGSIPESYGNLVNLQDLTLSFNQLSGSIPASLANLVEADPIDLRNNQLSGDVPAGVLALGTVNLWANPDLTGIAFGNPAACDIQTPLALNAQAAGELTPFEDCYFDDEQPLMADFYRLDLSGESATTLIQIDAYSDFYYPHVGVLDADGVAGLDVVDTQVQQNNLSFEVALPPGEYVLYIHGGTYQPRNVAATGTYTLGTTVINQPQMDCGAATWVTKGVELTAALSSEDCLDTFNNGNRLFDSYTIWLEQGESVAVVANSEITSQILVFNEAGFVSGSPNGAIDTPYGSIVTAATSGTYRIAMYNTVANAGAIGAYTISFQEPVQYGDPQACTAAATPLALGQSVADATLDQSADCLVAGRLQDRYAFSLSVDTLFRATMATQGFDPLMSVSTVDGRGLIAGSRAVVGNSLTVEYYLTAGDYVLQASSWIAETALPPRSGSYQLTLTDALAANQIQGECGYGTTLTIPGAVINGQLNSADCTVENEGITYTRDSYWLQLLPGQIVYPSLLADYPVAISYWHNGVFQRTYSADAGELLRLSLNQSGSHILSVAGRSDLELGDYQLTMGLSQPEVETIPIAFSYTFNSFSNVVDGVQQTGVSDHVLEGIVDAVMVDDDVFEVIALREATLDGNVYTIGEKPGIVAIRANQPALMSLSGSVLDVQICPNGFTSGTDCPFGAEGGFLISNFWPSTGPNAGQTNALAGHPALGAAYRDRSYPVVPGNWSAALVTEGISQRDVLIALYNAAGGDSWTSRAGWLGAGGTECDWYGVLCDSEGRVTALDLGNNNLTGTLPSALTLLGNLTALNLANNNLTGSVPEFSQSVTVNVSGNPLSEPAPAQQIYLSGSSTVFKGVFNNLPFFYNVSDGDATLTGVGVHVHYSSSQVDSISFANVLNTSLLAADASGSADINDLDNDPLTDRYITIGWTDINGTWPGSLPRKLMDLRVRISDVLDADDQLVLNFSRTSNTTGYDLELPRLTLDVITATLDVDGNGQVEALTDALMIIRNLFGFSGASLIDRAVANNATFTTAGDIQARLLDMRSILDVDGNGSVDALTDGLMIMRYLFGFRGNVLIANAIANNATRTTATQIEDYLAGLVP